jgi:ATP-dependent DNA helicase RecQ
VRHNLTFSQGIDLKDIELVIQWKVTCDPCILWQRFGRAARDKNLQATALLFVESKDCDQGPDKKTRKRKAVEDETDKACLQSKKAKKERPTPMLLETGEGAEGRFWKARTAAYHERAGDGKMEKGETNPVLDDVINAHACGIGCRRKPFHVYFENDKLQGLFTIPHDHFSLMGHRWSQV